MQAEGKNDLKVVHLDDLALEEVTAHEGEGRILFQRVFREDAFRGPWNFVDYAVLPPGTSIGLHGHGGNEELYLVLEGRGTMRLDGETFPVRAGSVILNRPGGVHGLSNDGPDPMKIFVVEVRIS